MQHLFLFLNSQDRRHHVIVRDLHSNEKSTEPLLPLHGIRKCYKSLVIPEN